MSLYSLSKQQGFKSCNDLLHFNKQIPVLKTEEWWFIAVTEKKYIRDKNADMHYQVAYIYKCKLYIYNFTSHFFFYKKVIFANVFLNTTAVVSSPRTKHTVI